MSYEIITATPLSPSLGAEIEGVDLAESICDELFAEIRAALVDHLVLFFRDQHISLDQQVAFTRRFGPRAPTPFIETMPEHPDVIEIIKEADEKSPVSFGAGWHTDFTFQRCPPSRTLLYAIDVPPTGGDKL